MNCQCNISYRKVEFQTHDCGMNQSTTALLLVYLLTIQYCFVTYNVITFTLCSSNKIN